MSSVDDLTPDQIAKYREAFRLYDKRGTGTIDVGDMGTIIRVIGHNPTEGELADIVSAIEGDVLDFPEFLGHVCKIKEENIEEKVRSAFKLFDKNNTGSINIEEFRQIVTSIGEKLSNEEFEEVVRVMKVEPDDKGNIVYEKLINTLVSV